MVDPQVVIRDYAQSDAPDAGMLIAGTFLEFNLNFASPDERAVFLGPFVYARSPKRAHQAAIARAIDSDVVYVADAGGEIVGVLRGRNERLASLFVRGDRHRKGIGRSLVERFEGESRRQGVRVIRVASTLFAIPFYLRLGYKRTTGVRSGRSFEGTGLQYQPMRKVLERAPSVVPAGLPDHD